MIFLETSHKIIATTIQKVLESEKKEHVEVRSGDFDGSAYRVKTADKNKSQLSISVSAGRAVPFLREHGMVELLRSTYGDLYQETPEDDFDVTLSVNLDNITDQNKSLIMEKVPLLKFYIMLAPFLEALTKFEKGESFEPMRIPYRQDESIYILTEKDNFLVVFSIRFKDPDDVVFAKTFLQEFVDARRKLSAAPAVSFTYKSKPLELKRFGSNSEEESEDIGFITFVLFKSHLEAKKREKTVETLLGFRSFFHYHLKATKAYMHMRMRTRVTDLLQALNRAKPVEGPKKEMKTAQGKTFLKRF